MECMWLCVDYQEQPNKLTKLMIYKLYCGMIHIKFRGKTLSQNPVKTIEACVYGVG